jgi:hypothetical protein
MPEAIAAFDTEFATAQDLLLYINDNVLESEITEDTIIEQDDGAQAAFADDMGTGVYAVIPWDEDQLFYEVHAPADDYEAAIEVANDILTQLAPAVACYVSTDSTSGVSLRLGPGLNRGAFTALTSADGEVLVLGQANAADGSLWWRVEEDNPNVNELWVADSDVIKTGGCGTVDEVAAPPIIAPAVPVAPVVQPPVTDGDTGGGDQPPVVTDTSLIPRLGMWNVLYPSMLNMSCEGTGNVTVPNDLGYLFPNGHFTLTSSDGGQTITWTDPAGYVIFIQDAPGHYTGNLVGDDPNWYFVVYLHVSGPTSMWGELIFGLIDPPCSGSLNFTMTYIG